MKKSYIFLAEGFEEIEALTPVDVMRRAGMPVATVSITDDATVTGAHGVAVVADYTMSEIDLADDLEWVILPGGLPGAQNLHNSVELNQLLMRQAQEGKVAAICASPAMALGPTGMLDGKKATGYPGTEQLAPNVDWQPDMVVALDRIVTGRGPAAALQFALAIVANSMGVEIARSVASGMLVKA